MRACKQCGLSIGDRATFCPVCGTLIDPDEVQPQRASAPPDAVPAPEAPQDLESQARTCEKSDPARAAALYRQAIVERLDLGEDLLTNRSLRRDVQRLFDRLSLVLKRAGLPEEALEEIETAAYLGLVDDATCGTKAQRDALVKRREALGRVIAKVSSYPS